MYRAIIFDVSDTLVHYNPDRENVILQRLNSIDINISTDIAKRIDRSVESCTTLQIYKKTQGDMRIDDDEFYDLIDEAIIGELQTQGFNLSDDRKNVLNSHVINLPAKK